MNDIGKDWKSTASGILLPPEPEKETVVEPARFALKVRGFAPETPIESYQITKTARLG